MSATIVGAENPLQKTLFQSFASTLFWKVEEVQVEVQVVPYLIGSDASHLLQAGAAIVGAASIVYSPHAPQPPSPSPSASPTAGNLGELGSAAEALLQLWSHWNPVTRASLVSNHGTEGKGASAGAS